MDRSMVNKRKPENELAISFFCVPYLKYTTQSTLNMKIAPTNLPAFHLKRSKLQYSYFII